MNQSLNALPLSRIMMGVKGFYKHLREKLFELGQYDKYRMFLYLKAIDCIEIIKKSSYSKSFLWLLSFLAILLPFIFIPMIYNTLINFPIPEPFTLKGQNELMSYYKVPFTLIGFWLGIITLTANLKRIVLTDKQLELMIKQREMGYYPNVFLGSCVAQVRHTENYDEKGKNNFYSFEHWTNKEENEDNILKFKLVNIGNGVAVNLSMGFDFDIEEGINLILSNSPVEMSYSSDERIFRFMDKEIYIDKYYYPYDNMRYDYLLRESDLSSSIYVSIPYSYLALYSTFIFVLHRSLEQNSLEQNSFNKNLYLSKEYHKFPKLFFDALYNDIDGKEHYKKYEIQIHHQIISSLFDKDMNVKNATAMLRITPTSFRERK